MKSPSITLVYIDDREGSKELSPYLDHCVITRLDSGDVCFDGNGVHGPVRIGVERKRISDLVNSITTGRLAAVQLPDLTSTYDVSYLIVEGVWKNNGEGIVEYIRGRWRHVANGRRWSEKSIWSFLTSVESAGITVRTTPSIVATAHMISHLAHWWGRPWSSHKSLKAKHVHDIRARSTINLSRPSLMRRIACELPGIGIDRSFSVAAQFTTVEEMVNATVDDWMAVDGVGKTVAHAVWDALHNSK